MTIHACLRTCLRKSGKSAARRIAVLLVGVAILSGCGDSAPSILAVKAVAAGVPSLAPFFDEGERLGRDEPALTSLEPHSGLQQGNAPGLYGGTQKPKVCDVRKLEYFLTAPENEQKAQEWARIVGIKVEGIGDYLDALTPVLLRHDTLVKNHDYKNGEAVPFDALLEAGIAVLVDDQGLPAVKCSCGNPLRAFDEDPTRIKVDFAGGNDRWKGYTESAIVVVRPAPAQLREIRLVDVEDPEQGISRAVGTTGESDTTFDTRARQAVPKVRGMTFAQASAAMADKGLAVTVAGDEMPPGDAPVTGSSPGPGARLVFGTAVALHMDWPGASSGTSTEDPGAGTGSGSGPGPGSSSGSGSGSGFGSGADSGSTGSGDDSTGPSETDGSSSGGSSSGGSSPDGSSSDGSSSGRGSTPTDKDTTPSGGGSTPTDDRSSPTDSSSPTSTGGTSLAPSPSKTSREPSPSLTTPTLPSTPPSPSRSSLPSPPPGPGPSSPPEDNDPPTETPTRHDPHPGPPSDSSPHEQHAWI
ncbi:DUF6777 domain-containing protein [Streptomyces sp. NPDC012510]|uniref:DUF6777 domain-containing protein n=1 Tax=Streptomyces sp. NPDC012510 TaxID=3364838 RepID=UPI0036E73B23